MDSEEKSQDDSPPAMPPKFLQARREMLVRKAKERAMAHKPSKEFLEMMARIQARESKSAKFSVEQETCIDTSGIEVGEVNPEEAAKYDFSRADSPPTMQPNILDARREMLVRKAKERAMSHKPNQETLDMIARIQARESKSGK